MRQQIIPRYMKHAAVLAVAASSGLAATADAARPADVHCKLRKSAKVRCTVAFTADTAKVRVALRRNGRVRVGRTTERSGRLILPVSRLRDGRYRVRVRAVTADGRHSTWRAGTIRLSGHRRSPGVLDGDGGAPGVVLGDGG